MYELPSMSTKHLEIYCSPTDNDPDTEKFPLEEAPWHYPWYIALKNESSTLVGIFRFEGPPVNGRVLLRVDEDRKYIDSSYATEALNEICNWVFSNKLAISIRVHHIPNDERYFTLLDKCGFEIDPDDRTKATKKKPASTWYLVMCALFMCLGITVGAIYNQTVNSDHNLIPVCFLVASVIGVAAGIYLDRKDKKAREDIIKGKKL